jgi:hypothetical protein
MTFESDAHGEGGAVINFRRQLHFTYIALHLSTDAFDLIENSKRIKRSVPIDLQLSYENRRIANRANAPPMTANKPPKG